MAKKNESVEIHVGDLRQRLGQRITIEIDLLLAPLNVVSSKTTDAPVVGALVIESIERGVTVTGDVSFGWIGDCRRCIDPVGGTETISVFEIFQYGAPEDTEIIDFDGEHVDLYPVVNDAVLTALPLVPLCSDECRGPDPERYPAVSADEFEQQSETPKADPRWSALSELNLEGDTDN